MHELESVARHRSRDPACVCFRSPNCKLFMDSPRTSLSSFNGIHDGRHEPQQQCIEESVRMPGVQFIIQERRVGKKVRDMV